MTNNEIVKTVGKGLTADKIVNSLSNVTVDNVPIEKKEIKNEV